MYKYDVLDGVYRVYTDWGNVKHYIAGFISYKVMIREYPGITN